MQKVNIAPKKRRTRLVTIGDFEVETRGLARGLLDRPLSPVHDRILAGVLRQCRLDLHHPQRCVCRALHARRSACCQCLGRPAAVAVLFLDRDPGDGRLRRHAPADQLRAPGRHRGNLHRHVVPGGNDRLDLRPLLAPQGPFRVRQISGGRQAPGPADADDPHRQRPPQHDLPGHRETVAGARGAHGRRRHRAPLSRAPPRPQRASGVLA